MTQFVIDAIVGELILAAVVAFLLGAIVGALIGWGLS